MNVKKAVAQEGKVVSFNWNWLVSKSSKEHFNGKPASYPAHALVLEFIKRTSKKAFKWSLAVVETGEIVDFGTRLQKKWSEVSDYAFLHERLELICNANPESPGSKSKFFMFSATLVIL